MSRVLGAHARALSRLSAARPRASRAGSATTTTMAAVQPSEAANGAKQAVRKRVREALKGMSGEDMAAESAAIVAQLLASPIFARSERIGVYIHSAKLHEVDTSRILEAALAASPGKRCYVPKVDDSFSNMRMLRIESLQGLELSSMNILEPGELGEDGKPREDVMEMDAPLDLLLMPGLAFDRGGRRLGRGGGFYDKFLASCMSRAAARGWEPPVTVALGFGVQVLEEVPMDDHDHPVAAVVTAEAVHYVDEAMRGHLQTGDP